MNQQFFAHSGRSEDRSDWQPLAEHLRNVGRLAGERAAAFGIGRGAEAAGLLHDLGKYTEEFQRRIAGDAVRVDHATHGAKQAIELYGKPGYLLAYAIAGHHAGLANGVNGVNGLERRALRERLQDVGLPVLKNAWKREIALPEQQALAFPIRPHSRERGGFQLAFLVRMLFSCLVDADFLDTEAFYDGLDGKASARLGSQPGLDALRERLDAYLCGFAADTEVNRVRADILSHVRRQAGCEPGLFSLTVPTGGGKTLASLAFALDHAICHGLRRVIWTWSWSWS